MFARSRIHHAVIAASVLAAALTTTTLVASSYAPKFFNDDPLWAEPETQDAAAIVPDDVNLFIDLIANLVRGRIVPAAPPRAQNLNTIDEVPNSSWYTNRGTLTPERVAVGPDTTDGPAAGPWTVIASKTDGVTPGFTVTDVNGVRWFIKFDPPGYRGMATGTEVTVSKLMWALGYNVPENHVAYLQRGQLVVGTSAEFTSPNGRVRPMRESDLDRVLDQASREPDGSYRVVASKALDGTPIGRIRFVGTRPDDPNDIVPHQHRRELRGYGVFAAWLNHVDAKATNSLDTVITEDGRSYVRHHLIDFGSALGSGSIAPADDWAGEEYLLQPADIGRQIIGVGFVSRPWQRDRFYESPAIGRMREEHRDFDPTRWRPRIPNQAFLHARDDDRFWAAQKLAAMTSDILRAAVKAGDFGDEAAEAFLVRALAQRRDAILRSYLIPINPIVDVSLDNTGTLRFSNAAVDADVARAPESYVAVWSEFDNLTRSVRRIGKTSSRATTMQAPDALPHAEGAYVKVELSASGGPNAAWDIPVDAYFRRCDGTWRLIGFERMPEE